MSMNKIQNSPKPGFRTSKFIVDPQVQIKVVSLLAAVAMASSVAICFVVYAHLDKVALYIDGSAASSHVLAEEFRKMTDSLMVRLGIIVVLMVSAFSILGFVLTHRIAGPIWKLRRELDRILKGEDIRSIKFRKDDEFQDLPHLINKLVENYKKSP